jgi:hypothetical protein
MLPEEYILGTIFIWHRSEGAVVTSAQLSHRPSKKNLQHNTPPTFIDNHHSTTAFESFCFLSVLPEVTSGIAKCKRRSLDHTGYPVCCLVDIASYKFIKVGLYIIYFCRLI